MTADIIQVDFETLAAVVRRFRQQQAEIEALQQTVAACLRRLESDGWQGQGANAFYIEMNDDVLPGICRLVEGLDEAAAVMHMMGDLFAAAEEEAAAQIDAGDGALTPFSTPYVAEGNFDLPTIFFKSGRLILDVVMQDEIFATLLKQGSLSNESLIGLLRHDWFKGGLVGADALFGFFNDVQQGTYGDDYLKAFGVNGMDSLIQFALAEGVPYVGVALLVNSAVQLGGTIEVGIRRTLTDLFAVDAEMGAMLHHDADQMGAALDKMDLGNISKEFSEAIYDTGARRMGILRDISRASATGMLALAQDPSFHTLSRVGSSLAQAVDGHGADLFYMTNPMLAFVPSGSGNDWQNLLDVGKASVNVLDGLADWGMAATAYNVHMGVNSLAQWANSSPYVPDALKAAVTQGAKDMVQAQQKQADWLIGLIDF